MVTTEVTASSTAVVDVVPALVETIVSVAARVVADWEAVMPVSRSADVSPPMVRAVVSAAAPAAISPVDEDEEDDGDEEDEEDIDDRVLVGSLGLDLNLDVALILVVVRTLFLAFLFFVLVVSVVGRANQNGFFGCSSSSLILPPPPPPPIFGRLFLAARLLIRNTG